MTATLLGAALIAAVLLNACLVLRELVRDPDHPGDPGEGEHW